MPTYKMQRQNLMNEVKRAAITWSATAIVSDDAHQFAAELEKTLNTKQREGSNLAHIFIREKEQGLVLVFQRSEFLAEPLDTAEETEPSKGNLQ